MVEIAFLDNHVGPEGVQQGFPFLEHAGLAEEKEEQFVEFGGKVLGVSVAGQVAGDRVEDETCELIGAYWFSHVATLTFCGWPTLLIS